MVEFLGGSRVARVVIGHDDPAQVRAGLGHESGVLRLGDRSDRTGVLDEVGDLGRDAPGVGGDRDASQPGDRVPRYDTLGAVVRVDQDLVPETDAAGRQSGCDLLGGLRELGIGPRPVRAVAGFPDQGMSWPTNW